jgi:hypothetical protein
MTCSVPVSLNFASCPEDHSEVWSDAAPVNADSTSIIETATVIRII